MEVMIEFRQTLFPVPVRPAIRRCGRVVRSTVDARPETSFPKKIGIFILRQLLLSSSITSRRRTMPRCVLGTSIPTVFFPGIGATIRTLGTLKAMAKSSARPVIFESLSPASSSTSYCAMTGPVSISTTRTLNPKSANVFSKIFALRRTSFSWDAYCNSSPGRSKLISGS